jgi:hypothetical protein
VTDLQERLAKAKREGTTCAHEFVPDGWVVTDSWTGHGAHSAVPQAWQTTHYRCKFCLMRESVS